MGIWVSLFDYRMPTHSFTISSLSLGFTAFSEQACWKVKKIAGASSNRKSYHKEIFASIRNQKLGGVNGLPSPPPDPLAPKRPAFWVPRSPPGPPSPAPVSPSGYVRSYVAGHCKSVAAIHRAKIDLILWSSHWQIYDHVIDLGKASICHSASSGKKDITTAARTW